MISFKLILCVTLIVSMASAQDYDSGDFDGDMGEGDMGGFGDGESGYSGGMSGSFDGADVEGGASFEGASGAVDDSRRAAAASNKVPLVYKIVAASKN